MTRTKQESDQHIVENNTCTSNLVLSPSTSNLQDTDTRNKEATLASANFVMTNNDSFQVCATSDVSSNCISENTCSSAMESRSEVFSKTEQVETSIEWNEHVLSNGCINFDEYKLDNDDLKDVKKQTIQQSESNVTDKVSTMLHESGSNFQILEQWSNSCQSQNMQSKQQTNISQTCVQETRKTNLSESSVYVTNSDQNFQTFYQDSNQTSHKESCESTFQETSLKESSLHNSSFNTITECLKTKFDHSTESYFKEINDQYCETTSNSDFISYNNESQQVWQENKVIESYQDNQIKEEETKIFGTNTIDSKQNSFAHESANLIQDVTSDVIYNHDKPAFEATVNVEENSLNNLENGSLSTNVCQPGVIKGWTAVQNIEKVSLEEPVSINPPKEEREPFKSPMLQRPSSFRKPTKDKTVDNWKAYRNSMNLSTCSLDNTDQLFAESNNKNITVSKEHKIFENKISKCENLEHTKVESYTTKNEEFKCETLENKESDHEMKTEINDDTIDTLVENENIELENAIR